MAGKIGLSRIPVIMVAIALRVNEKGKQNML